MVIYIIQIRGHKKKRLTAELKLENLIPVYGKDNNIYIGSQKLNKKKKNKKRKEKTKKKKNQLFYCVY